ncbi:Fanconi anemia group E protein isoform 2-T2 [Spinachia spinachia]
MLCRFDGRSRLLVRSLLCGTSGALKALDVFHRQQRVDPDMSLSSFLDTLCQDEVTCSVAGARPLTVRPLVCLFPALFKQNLLSFIYLVHSLLPRTPVLNLLKCLEQDHHSSPWVVALVRQLNRVLGDHNDPPLYTLLCSQRLEALAQRSVSFGETAGWAVCFRNPTVESDSPHEPGLSEVATKRKRKASSVTVDSDCEEMEQERKRKKMEVRASECHKVDQWGANEIAGSSKSEAAAETLCDKLQLQQDGPCDALPEHLKWDRISMQVVEVLNHCDPGQVVVLCSMLSLPDLPEQTLPNLCSSILAPAIDFSYSTTATLIKSLLLQKVLSLSEPASRCLVTAVTSLCSRYPRPTCDALIGPVLEEKDIGNLQAELLNRLIEGCLDSHYKLLVLQMTFTISWSEAVLSVIHSLLDSKLDFSEELFTQFSEQLLSQGSQFPKSVKFAKIMLTVLTKYNSHVTAAHKQSLQGCLMENETFLKKSLQVALKRISHA